MQYNQRELFRMTASYQTRGGKPNHPASPHKQCAAILSFHISQQSASKIAEVLLEQQAAAVPT